MITKKYWLFVPVVLLAVTFILPVSAQALTYQEIVTGQQSPRPQGRILGTVTPSPDINGDGRVNSFDAVVLIVHMGQNYPSADLNRDGVVNNLDLSILSSWWFASK